MRKRISKTDKWEWVYQALEYIYSELDSESFCLKGFDRVENKKSPRRARTYRVDATRIYSFVCVNILRNP